MSCRTLKDIGSDFVIPEKVDAAVYSLITEDCIIKGVGDEFAMVYTESSLQVTFNAGSQAIIEGNAFWLPEEEKITLPASESFNVALRIDTTQPYGSTGSIVALTDTEIKSNNINNDEGTVRDYVIYKVTTGASGVTSVTDCRTIRDGDIVKGITGILPKLTVSDTAGTIITAKCGTETVTAVTSSDKVATLYLTMKGTWTVTDGLGNSETVEVIDCGNYDINFLATIMGVTHSTSNSSPELTRTDAAVGLTFTASVGNTAGSSGFDDMPIYKDIKRETLSTGDTMVKIPKFWFQRIVSNDIESIRIADKEVTGFTLHPAFDRPDGERDYIYVGAYKTSNNDKSITGASPTVNQTRATMRSNAKNKGAHWGLLDLATINAIQMLIIVEIANLNVQSIIGEGYSASGHTAAISTGKCDAVPNLTGRPAGTSNDVDVVWRGIEGFWGNVWEWFDGLNFNGGTYYISNNQDKYADDTATGYEALSYSGSTGWSGSYITMNGYDENHPEQMLPTVAGSGSASTYYCDGVWSSTGWRVAGRGGYWPLGSLDGLWSLHVDAASSATASHLGSRLLYLPV